MHETHVYQLDSLFRNELYIMYIVSVYTNQWDLNTGF